MTQQLKVLAAKPEFNPQNLHGGRKREYHPFISSWAFIDLIISHWAFLLSFPPNPNSTTLRHYNIVGIAQGY